VSGLGTEGAGGSDDAETAASPRKSPEQNKTIKPTQRGKTKTNEQSQVR
jgi:hypothetical protein